jgi:hypothetical protein
MYSEADSLSGELNGWLAAIKLKGLTADHGRPETIARASAATACQTGALNGHLRNNTPLLEGWWIFRRLCTGAASWRRKLLVPDKAAITAFVSDFTLPFTLSTGIVLSHGGASTHPTHSFR